MSMAPTLPLHTKPFIGSSVNTFGTLLQRRISRLANVEILKADDDYATSLVNQNQLRPLHILKSHQKESNRQASIGRSTKNYNGRLRIADSGESQSPIGSALS